MSCFSNRNTEAYEDKRGTSNATGFIVVSNGNEIRLVLYRRTSTYAHKKVPKYYIISKDKNN